MPGEQLDLINRAYPSLRPSVLTMIPISPGATRKKRESPPERYSVRDDKDKEVATIWDPHNGAVQWYTKRGGGRSTTPNAALDAIRKCLGETT